MFPVYFATCCSLGNGSGSVTYLLTVCIVNPVNTHEDISARTSTWTVAAYLPVWPRGGPSGEQNTRGLKVNLKHLRVKISEFLHEVLQDKFPTFWTTSSWQSNGPGAASNCACAVLWQIIQFADKNGT